MVVVNFTRPAGISIKGNSWMIWRMDSGFISTTMDQNTSVTGDKTNKMDSGKRNGMMAANMKASIKMPTKRAKENTLG